LGPVFKFCAPGLIFGGNEGAGSRFHVLRSRSRFPRYRGHRVPFSSFAFPDSFSAVPRASGLVFMFCAPGLVSGGTEGVGSRFHVLRVRTRFRPYRGCRVSFLYFALPNSFSAVPRASDQVFMFCAPGLIFGDAECVGTLFHVFVRSDSFSAVPRASDLVFMFSAPGHVFGGAEGIRSRFYVLRSRTHFLQYRGRRVPFACFARPDSFLAKPRASAPVFMFCVPGLVVGSCFHVLRARTRFRRYQGHRVPFSYFALPDMFSTVPRVSGPVFMFCTPGHVFGRTEGVLVSFSCFVLLDSFSAVPRASGPVFMF
jgi:hypothetical protein